MLLLYFEQLGSLSQVQLWRSVYESELPVRVSSAAPGTVCCILHSLKHGVLLYSYIFRLIIIHAPPAPAQIPGLMKLR